MCGLAHQSYDAVGGVKGVDRGMKIFQARNSYKGRKQQTVITGCLWFGSTVKTYILAPFENEWCGQGGEGRAVEGWGNGEGGTGWLTRTPTHPEVLLPIPRILLLSSNPAAIIVTDIVIRGRFPAPPPPPLPFPPFSPCPRWLSPPKLRNQLS